MHCTAVVVTELSRLNPETTLKKRRKDAGQFGVTEALIWRSRAGRNSRRQVTFIVLRVVGGV